MTVVCVIGRRFERDAIPSQNGETKGLVSDKVIVVQDGKQQSSKYTLWFTWPSAQTPYKTSLNVFPV